MVKRIIPGNMSPWECEINDVKYVYPPGTEQTVPDEVAHVIDAWYASQEPKYPEPESGGGSGGAQPDWNAAEGEPGHILNRPFCETFETLFNQTVELPDAGGLGMLQMEADLSRIGDTATVTLDGVAYECDVAIPVPGQKTVGNLGLLGEGEDNGLPFCIITAEGILMIFGEAGTHSIKIASPVIESLDRKFVPSMRLTVNVLGEYDQLSADRTFAEIREAHNKGMCVIAYSSGAVYQLCWIDSEVVVFTYVMLGAPGSTGGDHLNVNKLEITNTNVVTISSGAIAITN